MQTFSYDVPRNCPVPVEMLDGDEAEMVFVPPGGALLSSKGWEEVASACSSLTETAEALCLQGIHLEMIFIEHRVYGAFTLLRQRCLSQCTWDIVEARDADVESDHRFIFRNASDAMRGYFLIQAHAWDNAGDTEDDPLVDHSSVTLLGTPSAEALRDQISKLPPI